jgi:hypothetical protein
LIKSFSGLVAGYHHLVIKARTSGDSAGVLWINLLLADGRSYGARVEIGEQWQESGISFSEFQPRPSLLLPDSYPLFLPHAWADRGTGTIRDSDLRILEEIQVVVDPADVRKRGEARESGFELVAITLTQ